MKELKKLADALGHLCRGADLLAASRGLYERREGDLPRLDPYVTVTMNSYGATVIDADVLLHDYTGDGADYRKERICHESDTADSDNMEGYEFDKTVDGIYDRIFLDLIGQIIDGKLAGAEEETGVEASLPLRLVRNHRTGKLDVVDDNSAVVASFAPDEVIDAETESPDGIRGHIDAWLKDTFKDILVKGTARENAVARLEALLNKIKGNAGATECEAKPCGVQMTAEHPDGTPQEEKPAEAEAEAEAAAPKPTRTRKPRTADKEDRT